MYARGWMLVDRYTHRIARRGDGVWAMYCPERGPGNLIHCASWQSVLTALRWETPCPHDELTCGRPTARYRNG